MLVSIIIPCFNVEDYIDDCVESVINQTYKTIEIICVDNNSTDKTLLKLKMLKARYTSIVILNEEKKGACFARNKGLNFANGEWVQFLDADDIIMANKLEHQVKLIKNSNVPFIAAASFRLNIKNETSINIPNDNIWKGLFLSNLGITSANLFRRMSIIKVNGWDNQLNSSQEYDLMFKLIVKIGKPLIDKQPLTIVRERFYGQISQQNPVNKWIQFINLRLDFTYNLKSSNKFEYNKNKEWIQQQLFLYIRILSKYNKEESYKYLLIHTSYKFRPKQSNSNMISYLILFRLFGFKNAERIKSILIRENNNIKV